MKMKFDGSHKPQVKYEYDVHLLNYTIKINNLNWAFEVYKTKF